LPGNHAEGNLALPSRRHLRILLTEGSSLSARQTLYALGRAGHIMDVCDPRPLWCLGRWSRYVRACYRCPSFTADPAGYLEFLLRHLRRQRYDVLFPTHDQVYLLARCADRFRGQVGVAVPGFAAVDQLQSKAGFLLLLDELGLPHPRTELVRTRGQLERAARFPCYVKRVYGTAGCGVWLVRDAAELQQTAAHLEQAGLLNGDSDVLVQQPAPGNLCVVQAVFHHGRLLAGHCYEARALGVGGSAWARIGVAHPQVLRHLAALGGHLGWHGALMMDYLHEPATGRLAYIDASPRIGETLNATFSGVNLCELLVGVALGDAPAPLAPPRRGVLTHGITMALLAEAQRGANRRRLVGELGRALAGWGLYHGSQDELTRPAEDPLSLVPAVFLVLRLLARPAAAQGIITATVDRYALSDEGARRIRQGF
jgi:predicted ATP-grasp superfamily ATP-dependent carboligase